MIRNVCKEDLPKVNELIGKTVKEDDVDFKLSMLDEVEGEIVSVFLVGVYRIPQELKGFDTECFYHEILGIYTKESNDEILIKLINKSMETTRKLILYWVSWSDEYAEVLKPVFVEKEYRGMRFLYYITLTKIISENEGKLNKNFKQHTE